MINSISLVMYGTSACSLCDQAFDLLVSMPELAGLSLRVIDVAQDPLLAEQYGSRLPVLRVNALEIDWVFTTEAVRRALRQASEKA